jgi:hypothetical protein
MGPATEALSIKRQRWQAKRAEKETRVTERAARASKQTTRQPLFD